MAPNNQDRALDTETVLVGRWPASVPNTPARRALFHHLCDSFGGDSFCVW